MRSADRLEFYLDEIEQAAMEICDFVAGMNKDRFLSEIIRQRAVAMNLLRIGEAIAKVVTEYPEVVVMHPDVPWERMRGMRNRIAHGYLQINQNTVWDTTQTSIPDLLTKLRALRQWRAEGE
ncbi:MAG: DUF86 domain-containing protein [Allorhizobium sp.]